MKKIKKISVMISLSILIMLTGMQVLAQQTFNGDIVEPTAAQAEILSATFTEQGIFQFDIEKFNRFVKENGDYSEFTLRIGDLYSWDIELNKNEMRSPDYFATQMTDEGPLAVIPGPCVTYKGKINGVDESSEIRLGIDYNMLNGFIRWKSGYVFIEQMGKFDLTTEMNQFIIYEPKDVIRAEGGCGLIPSSQSLQKNIENSVEKAQLTPDCRKLEIATESDYNLYFSYQINPFNGNSSFPDIQANLNMVEGVYQSTYNIDFVLKFQNEWATSSDPYTTSTPCGTVYSNPCSDPTNNYLSEFGCYWNTNFSSIKRDKSILYSGVEWCVTSGQTTSCTFGCTGLGYPYSVNTEFNRTSSELLGTVAHELGHQFNATHANSSGCAEVCPGACYVDIFGNCVYDNDPFTGCPLEGAGSLLCSGNTKNTSSPYFSSANDAVMEAYMNGTFQTNLRTRYYAGTPAGSNQNVPILNGVVTGNDIIADEATTYLVTNLTLRGTDSVSFRPGFSFTGGASAQLTGEIGACDPNQKSMYNGVPNYPDLSLPLKSVESSISIYPNPFTNQTTIELTVVEDDAPVTVEVHDLVGKRVAVLADNQNMDIGKHRLVFQTDQTAGSFFLASVRIGEREFVEKIMRIY